MVPGNPKRTYKTAVVVDPRGELVARYRKIHLFDVDIPGAACARAVRIERTRDRARRGPVVVDIAGAQAGLSICYDVRFPELYRSWSRTRARRSVVTRRRSRRNRRRAWELLLRARAIEDQA